MIFDYDNDGRPDVYLPHLGCGMLFHNLGGRFEDVTAKSGLGDCRNAVTAVPIDFDGDGKLDLYVVRYWKAIDYFHLLARGPRVWTENFSWSRNGGDNTLYRNRGDGTFEDVTASRGGSDTGWSWDAGAADFAGDGTQRIYVANDFGPDQIFDATEGKLAHIDTGTVLGLVDRRAGMGVSFGDLTHDGRPHIYVSNESTRYFSPQHGNFLWHFTGSEHADDEAYSRGVHNCGEWSWGALFADFDLDGKEDLYVAAGMITGNVESDFPMFDFIRRTGMTIPGIFADLPDWPSLKGRSLAGGVSDCVFWNRGDRFRDVSGFTGITKAWDGRAVAAIDFDNNGSLDLIVTTRTGQAHLLRNTVVPGQHWVAFALRGTRSNRDGAGARVEVRQAGQPPQFRWATAGKSGFLANSDPRIHFGLPVVQPLDVFVRWPSGKVDSHHGMDPGKIHTLVEGKDSE
ncbi:MAG: CRTAC1 family protein [Deltaproteobacteria bacterium]|nr:CRTAC1 family protein [Deltaproteobacteria bacterium]